MISYRTDFGCWWPLYDAHPEKCFRFVQNGLADMDVAIRHCRGHKLAVQAGGHAGLWPKRLAGYFKQVITYEPDPALLACLIANCEGLNIIASAKALGATVGEVSMRPAKSAGSWRVAPDGAFRAQQTTIDAIGLDHCDVIFLDVEGYEVEALKGAATTIQRFHPVIHVEELPRSRKAIRAHLEGLGYRRVAQVHSDCVYV